MLNNCQRGHFLPFPETPTRHDCLHRALVIHLPSSFLNRAPAMAELVCVFSLSNL